MRIIFADASYWIALMNPRDKSHETAKSVSEELGNHQMVTSEMVLIELLDYMAEYGEEKRKEVVKMVKDIKNDPNMEIVRQTSEQFWAAVDYYESPFGQGMGGYGLRQFPIDGSKRYVGIPKLGS